MTNTDAGQTFMTIGAVMLFLGLLWSVGWQMALVFTGAAAMLAGAIIARESPTSAQRGSE